MTVLVQNFSVPADNDLGLQVNVDPTLNLAESALLDGTVYWRVYEEQLAIPDFDLPSPEPSALIEKSTMDGSILIGSPATTFTVMIHHTDTAALLANYYHESTLVDLAGNVSTLNCGILTVTETMFR